MSKFYTMGRYTDKGLAGFVNNPKVYRIKLKNNS